MGKLQCHIGAPQKLFSLIAEIGFALPVLFSINFPLLGNITLPALHDFPS